MYVHMKSNGTNLLARLFLALQRGIVKTKSFQIKMINIKQIDQTEKQRGNRTFVEKMTAWWMNCESGYRLIASFVWYNEGEKSQSADPQKHGSREGRYLCFWVFGCRSSLFSWGFRSIGNNSFRLSTCVHASFWTQTLPNYITIHFPQQPECSPGSLTSILLSGARDPNAPEPDG